MFVFPSWSIINLFQISKYYHVPTTTRNKYHMRVNPYCFRFFKNTWIWKGKVLRYWLLKFFATPVYFLFLSYFFSFHSRTSLTYRDAVCCRSTYYWQVYHWLKSHTAINFITRSPVILTTYTAPLLADKNTLLLAVQRLSFFFFFSQHWVTSLRSWIFLTNHWHQGNGATPGPQVTLSLSLFLSSWTFPILFCLAF